MVSPESTESEKETGLQYLETMIRYLASVLDEDQLSMNQIKEMAEQAISKTTRCFFKY